MGTNKKIIGLIEMVTIIGQTGEEEVKAKIDTGADRSSVDLELAAKVGLGPVTRTVKVRSSLTRRKTRIVAEAKIVLQDQTFDIPVSLGDRSQMNYDIIVGKDVLTQSDLLIDPRK